MRLVLAAVLVFASCAAPDNRPPFARVAVTPTAILVHDEFRTEVLIDGSASGTLEDPQADLDYAWQFLDDEARTEQGLDQPMLMVRFRGDRPPRILLTVTSSDGLSGAITQPIQLTLP